MRDQRAIDAAGELLQAREQRGATGNDRQRLEQPDARVPFHGVHQADQRGGSHDAVGVQDQELRIGRRRNA